MELYEIMVGSAVIAGLIVSILAIIKSIRSGQKSKDNETTIGLLNTNHLDHIKESIIEIKEDNKDIWKVINEIKKNGQEIGERISKIEGKMNGGLI